MSEEDLTPFSIGKNQGEFAVLKNPKMIVTMRRIMSAAADIDNGHEGTLIAFRVTPHGAEVMAAGNIELTPEEIADLLEKTADSLRNPTNYHDLLKPRKGGN